VTLATPAKTIAVLQRFDLHLSKSLGQNFLVDENILRKIEKLAELKTDDIVLEIGPGIGTVTQVLASSTKSVIAVEYDRKFLPVLEDTLRSYGNVMIFHSDAMGFDLASAAASDLLPSKMVSNLPYNIATPLLLEYLKKYPFLRSYTVMVQKEIAARMMAEPSTKSYSASTLILQYYCRVSPGFTVSRNVFLPPPKVDSAVVKLERLARPEIEVGDQELLFRLIKAAFRQRRKTIRNALAAGTGFSAGQIESILQHSGVDPARRGETLSLEEFGTICVGFEQLDPLDF
jgi:16S rRNA (adenine1518-N6/adenine1519-N6)-dimethyltransferase